MKSLAKVIVTFIALLTAGIIIVVTSGFYVEGNNLLVLINVGSAIIGGSLAFFLVEVFRWDKRKNTVK